MTAPFNRASANAHSHSHSLTLTHIETTSIDEATVVRCCCCVGVGFGFGFGFGFGLWALGFGFGLWALALALALGFGFGLWALGFGLWLCVYDLVLVGLMQPRVVCVALPCCGLPFSLCFALLWLLCCLFSRCLFSPWSWARLLCMKKDVRLWWCWLETFPRVCLPLFAWATAAHAQRRDALPR